MILVDTFIWIDHLRQSCEKLVQLLGAGQILTHPYIIGELALGSLQNRNAVLGALQNIPQVPVATDNEVLHFIETNALYGIGYIDAHLLAAARLSPGTLLWTRDKRLLDASTRLVTVQSPLWQRGVRGDFGPVARAKSPPAPLFQRGEVNAYMPTTARASRPGNPRPSLGCTR
jgi:hypothetical protein